VPRAKLAAALESVDWKANVNAFLMDTDFADRVAFCGLRLAQWSKQFENADKGNPALCFVREMQLAGHNVATLAALALYKAAAGSIRTIVESALYYTYFRTHPTELSTLARDAHFFVTKTELLEYHKTHTVGFPTCQQQFGLISTFDQWYSHISAIVHGQIPGVWSDYRSLGDVAYSKKTLGAVVEAFVKGERLVHHLFLCTAGRELWSAFSSQGKAVLIAGLKGSQKTALKLDSA
jgi:hypothetical protein